jgi:hypothetical protein
VSTGQPVRIFVTGLAVRWPWAWVWMAADAVAVFFTVVYGLGTGFPLWDLMILWAVAIALTGWLLAYPPHLAHEYDLGPDEDEDDGWRLE